MVNTSLNGEEAVPMTTVYWPLWSHCADQRGTHSNGRLYQYVFDYCVPFYLSASELIVNVNFLCTNEHIPKREEMLNVNCIRTERTLFCLCFSFSNQITLHWIFSININKSIDNQFKECHIFYYRAIQRWDTLCSLSRSHRTQISHLGKCWNEDWKKKHQWRAQISDWCQDNNSTYNIQVQFRPRTCIYSCNVPNIAQLLSVANFYYYFFSIRPLWNSPLILSLFVCFTHM